MYTAIFLTALLAVHWAAFVAALRVARPGSARRGALGLLAVGAAAFLASGGITAWYGSAVRGWESLLPCLAGLGSMTLSALLFLVVGLCSLIGGSLPAWLRAASGAPLRHRLLAGLVAAAVLCGTAFLILLALGPK